MEDFEDFDTMSVTSGTSITLSTVSADEDSAAVPRCTTHRKRLKFFCRKHKLLVCSVCAVKRHRQCDEVLTLQEAMEDKKCEGKKILKIYNERISSIESAITERRASKKLLESNVHEIQTEIHNVVERLVDLLRSEERSLVQTLTNMQARETDILDKDIHSLEGSCSTVRESYSGLENSLKGKDIDLIHAVIKEQQILDDTTEKDVFVKKKFKDPDIKFTVSPQVQSFTKQFKNLGKVIMTDGEVTRENNQYMHRYSSMNDLSRSATTKRAGDVKNISALGVRDDTHIDTRTRWSRERQQQKMGDRNFAIQSRAGITSSPASNSESGTRNGTSRYHNNTVSTDNSNISSDTESTGTQDSNPKIKENGNTGSNGKVSPQGTQSVKSNVAKFTSQFKFAKSDQVEYEDRKSPVAIRQQPELDSTIHVVARRITPTPPQDGPPNTSNTENRNRSPNPLSTVKVATLDIIDEDFGRSFAAVQVKEAPAGPTVAENNDAGHTLSVPKMGLQIAKPSTTRTYSPNTVGNGTATPRTDQPVNGSPNGRRRPNFRMGVPGHRKSFENLNLAISSADSPSPTVEEMKGRRWTLKKAFAPQGYGTKKLVSGVGIISDGKLVVVDQENYSVQLFDKDFNFLCEFKLESRPFDVAVLSDNKIVVSLQSERVLKFFLVSGDTLNPVADLGVPCELVCYGLCRGGGVYCVCCGNEVWVLSDQGRIVNKLRNDTNGRGLFARAEYVDLDKTGNVMYVADAGSQKVLAVQIQDGRRLWEFSRQGFEPGGLKVIEHYLYLADRGQHRILMVNMEGQIVRQNVVGRIENPCAVCFNNAANSMVITQMRHDTICVAAMPIHVYQLG